MNRINIQQTGGFPLETDTLNAMQNAYDIFNSLGNIIAPLAIIKGCEILGNSVANGVVYINGEVVEFRGGQAGATVIIREETQNKNFENGENKLVCRTRYATFGSSVQTTNYPWSDFHRPKTLQQLEAEKAEKATLDNIVTRVKKLEVFARPFSSGFGAVLFLRPAAEIPEGWEEVTDLRGRMPIGQNPDDANLSSVLENFLGGSKTKQIYKSNLPAEGIGYKDAYYIENATTGGLDGTIYVGENKFGSNKSDNDNNRLFYRNATTDNLGNGVELDVMNPYRIVIFIKPKQ